LILRMYSTCRLRFCHVWPPLFGLQLLYHRIVFAKGRSKGSHIGVRTPHSSPQKRESRRKQGEQNPSSRRFKQLDTKPQYRSPTFQLIDHRTSHTQLIGAVGSKSPHSHDVASNRDGPPVSLVRDRQSPRNLRESHRPGTKPNET
jgi:hypothetical protein